MSKIIQSVYDILKDYTVKSYGNNSDTTLKGKSFPNFLKALSLISIMSPGFAQANEITSSMKYLFTVQSCNHMGVLFCDKKEALKNKKENKNENLKNNFVETSLNGNKIETVTLAKPKKEDVKLLKIEDVHPASLTQLKY